MTRYARINTSELLKRGNQAKKVIQEEARRMAEEAAQFGEERMKEYIRERGTRFSDAAQQAGVNRGPGRIRTGNMYNSVSSRVESGSSRTLAAFGWLRNFEEYFQYQETGFRNRFIAMYTPGGRLLVQGSKPIIRRNPFGGYKNTPGMFALRDARADVETYLPKLTTKYRTRITKRINQG